MKEVNKINGEKMEEKLNMNRNYRVSEEEMKVNRIKGMYNMMISEGVEQAVRSKLVRELLNLQKKDGSWSVIDDYRCDSDIRVVYVYEPTYYATAALIYADLIDDYDMKSIEKIALLKGLEFAKGRCLCGHGYRATESKINSLEIYKQAGLYQWMKKNENLAKEFCQMIQNIIEGFRKALITGQVYSDWQRNFRTEFEKEVMDYEEAMITYVWYAAYGSNSNKARFMEYIKKCSDKTAPLEDRPIIIPFDIYFAYSSSRWERKGVAFLNDSKEGMTWGRMYKITMNQFNDIQRMEGNIYGKRISLGTVEDTPVYTFTSPSIRTDIKEPSKLYINTIKEGLKEIYPDKTDLVIDTYLFGKGIISEDDYKVLNTLRNSAHGMTLQSITESGICITRVKKSIKKLYEYGLVVQDSRSVRAGDGKLDANAVVYTSKEKREMIDMLLLWKGTSGGR